MCSATSADGIATPVVTVRALTAADLSAVAATHCAAFPRSGYTALGPAIVQRHYAWQLSGEPAMVALGAYAGPALVGFCFAGGAFRDMRSFVRANRAFVLGHLLAHPRVVWRSLVTAGLAARVRRLIRRRARRPAAAPSAPRATPAFWIHAIAVSPHHQGLGIGRLLAEASEVAARARGAQEMRLAVRLDNAQGIRFYERTGWQRVAGSQGWGGQMRKSLVR